LSVSHGFTQAAETIRPGGLSHPPIRNENESTTQYKMNRELVTVEQAWREYYYGLGDGVQIQSIKSLEENIEVK
jgi:hypothetical protein